jgi:bla regulator protein blaR1
MMNELNQLASTALMRAAGLTLLHSLWQGTLIALSTAALLTFLHRRPARLRYQVLVAALLILTTSTVFTFCYCYYAASASTTVDSVIAKPLLLGTTATALQFLVPASYATKEGDALTGPAARLLGATSGYVERHVEVIVWIWALGVLGMSLRFAAGLIYSYRLRRYHVVALPGHWQQRVSELARRAGLRQPVQALASALVSTPVVIGHFKPLILIPLGAISGLSLPELEMIIAHEIGHIIRKDYLVNALQLIAEVLFFYHPAVWFLSAGLRTEREKCCDDFATQIHGNSLLLARALSSLAEWTYANRVPQLALAATGPRRSALIDRVQRLIEPSAATSYPWDGFGVAGFVLVSFGIVMVSTFSSVGAIPSLLSIYKVNTNVGLSSQAADTGVRALMLEHYAFSSGVKPLQSGEELRASFETQLLHDGLIKSRDRYTYKLTARTFSVNGLLQPADIFEKYRIIYEKGAGMHLKADNAYETTKNSQRNGISSSTDLTVGPTKEAALSIPVTPQPDANEVARELARDGIIATGSTAYDLVLNRDGLMINGEKQSSTVTEKYRRFLHAPLDAEKHTSTDVTIHRGN